MVALDTNVLLRYLIDDDRAQRHRARSAMDDLSAADESGFVPDVVLVELAWVLRSAYRADRRTVLTALAAIKEARHLVFESHERFEQALAAFAAGKGDFSDCLIRERALEQGCEAVITFDRSLLGEDGFVAP